MPSRQRWWVQDAGVTLAALLALLVWDAAGADLAVSRWFGSSSGFGWRDHWLTAQLLHTGGRWLSFGVLVGLVWHVMRPLGQAGNMRHATRVWWLLVTVACLVMIPLAKGRSMTSCPWELAEFGGHARYLAHWSMQAWSGAGDGGSGHCFPSGHASAAFSFLGGWFVLRGRSRPAARLWLASVCLLGVVFGMAQVARGAHYPSHVAWTAWICWALSATVWHAAQPMLEASPTAPVR